VPEPLGDQLVDPFAGHEGWVELHQWIGPEMPLVQTLLDKCFDLLISDREEVAHIRRVAIDNIVAEPENVQ
jgi:hypothetical protein